MRKLQVALTAALSLALCGSVHAGAEPSREFSTQERAHLAAGGLVRRPMVQHRGTLDLMGGTSYQVIDAPPKVVWKALLDTSHYPRMMPQVLEARLVHDAARVRTVFMRQGAGFIETAYYLTVRMYEDRGDITFTIDDRRPHDLRAAWGFYTVRPYAGGNKTLLAYGVMADIGAGVFGAMVRGDVHDWMLRVPWTVKRFVEGSGRRLYRSVWPRSTASIAAPPRG